MKKFVVIFPSDILKRTDVKVLKRIERLGNARDVEVKCIVGTNGLEYDKDTMYIVDECDYDLFDQGNLKFIDSTKVKAWIGLTASSAATSMEFF